MENKENEPNESKENEPSEKSSDAFFKDLFYKNTESFRCLAQILISRSSIFRHPLYHFPPLEDQNIDEVFNFTEPAPVIDDIGYDSYVQLCKDFKIIPNKQVLRSLCTKELNLKYYGLTELQIRAISTTLHNNKYVLHLILEDNWLTPKAAKYLGDMFIKNLTLKYVNLKGCIMKPEGASNIEQGILKTTSIQKLNLSWNNLEDRGMIMLETALTNNTSIVVLNLSHNNLGDDAAKVLELVFSDNNFLQDIDLSWNNFNTDIGNKALFSGLALSLTIKRVNVAWNNIGTVQATTPIVKLLVQTEKLEYFDISNNRLTGESFNLIRNGITKCATLKTLKIGSNLITPGEAYSLLKVFNATRNALVEINMENTYVNRNFVPVNYLIE